MGLSDNIDRGFKASKPLLKELGLLLVFLTGLVFVSYGFWLAWEPAGFIVAGVLLAGLVALYVRGESVPRPPRGS